MQGPTPPMLTPICNRYVPPPPHRQLRHVGVDDLSGGDEVVLTLADRGILDAKGNLDEDDDELENVRRGWGGPGGDRGRLHCVGGQRHVLTFHTVPPRIGAVG